MSVCNNSVSLIHLYRRQPLANRCTEEETLEGRLLMYTKNRREPSTAFLGTPEVTGAGNDDFPSRTTCWLLLESLDPRQGLVSNSIMMEISSKALMCNFIKHLAEVQQKALVSVESCCKFTLCNQILGLTGSLFLEAMLIIVQYLVLFKELH